MLQEDFCLLLVDRVSNEAREVSHKIISGSPLHVWVPVFVCRQLSYNSSLTYP
jgi:hypothetical protein